MSKYGDWENRLTDIEDEIDAETQARVAKGVKPKEADGEVRGEVGGKYREELLQIVREIEQEIATIESEPDDREERDSDIERHEELRDRIHDLLDYAA